MGFLKKTFKSVTRAVVGVAKAVVSPVTSILVSPVTSILGGLAKPDNSIAEALAAQQQAALDKAAAEAAARERDKHRARAGRSSTVLTSLTGDTSTASTATKTLLGG